MRYENWNNSKKIETQYRKSLNSIVDTLKKVANTSKDINEYNKKMDTFQKSDSFYNYMYLAVKKMVTPISINNEATWRKAARKASKSSMIYRSLMAELSQGLGLTDNEQINRNATIISTLPLNVAEKVTSRVKVQTLNGLRASEISKIISKETDKYARASAALIARTEVSKTTTALTRSRSENMQVRWYIWRTALDGDRVRKSHRKMEGVVVNWQNPPSPELLVGEPPAKGNSNYHAGEIYNCRCYPEPIIDPDDLDYPVKVYKNGSIIKMNKKEFSEVL
jgi:SPP1 gp7 family putative phage head morphogenesis protein